MREELRLQGEYTTKTRIVATNISYFYNHDSELDEKVLKRVNVTPKTGENSLELLFGNKEYIVIFESNQYQDIDIIGYHSHK